MRKSSLRAPLVTLIALTLSLAGISHAQSQYYRYVDNNGVEVLGYSIPPEFVKNGYEIVSANGHVIQVVEPAPDPEFVERERALAALKEQYEMLARRYSSVRDIEAAKNRKLVHVDASILLVESSIDNIKEEISDISSRAAEFERAGKPVPDNLLNNLQVLNEKMVATQAILLQRIEEKTIIEKRFAAEQQLFTEGAAMFEKDSTQSLNDDQDSGEQ
jgi:hypothetical protein